MGISASPTHHSHVALPRQMCQERDGDVLVSRSLIYRSAEKYGLRFDYQKKDASISKVTHLHLNNRKITGIGSDISECKGLKVLYLYENNISTIQNLECCRQLTHLYLQNNNISKIDGLDSLLSLKKLYLDRNKIQKIENLGGCKNLEELHVSHQTQNQGCYMEFGSVCMKQLGEHGSLKVMIAASNRIIHPEPLASVGSLRRVDLSANAIYDMRRVTKFITGCPLLTSLRLNGCPVGKTFKYRDHIIRASLSLDELDGEPVPQNHRDFLISFDKTHKSKGHHQSKQQQRVKAWPMQGEGCKAKKDDDTMVVFF